MLEVCSSAGHDGVFEGFGLLFQFFVYDADGSSEDGSAEVKSVFPLGGMKQTLTQQWKLCSAKHRALNQCEFMNLSFDWT